MNDCVPSGERTARPPWLHPLNRGSVYRGGRGTRGERIRGGGRERWENEKKKVSNDALLEHLRIPPYQKDWQTVTNMKAVIGDTQKENFLAYPCVGLPSAC